MSRRFDLVLFGVTGFTGKYALEKLVQLGQHGKYPRKFTWAVAGRNNEKIKKALEEVGKDIKTDLSNVATIEANVDDVSSLRQMAAQCSVVVSVVGPYMLYGRNQVEACVAESTSFVDLTGEVPFIAETYAQFHKEAEQKGVYIVNSCGYDSVLMDYGIAALQEKFSGEFNQVTCTMVLDDSTRSRGAVVHYGTYCSIVQMMSKARELPRLERLVFTEPEIKSKVKPSYSLWKPFVFDEEVGKWCLKTGTGPDTFHSRRTQQLMYLSENRRPAHVMEFMALPNIFACFGVAILFAWWFVLAQFGFTKRLLEQYPRVFSFGLASHEGPSKEAAEKGLIHAVIRGVGWDDKKGLDRTDEPTVKKSLTIPARNPGYAATSIMLIESALSIVFEKDKLYGKGGVLPPGAAFAKTELSKRLTDAGITFDYDKVPSAGASRKTD